MLVESRQLEPTPPLFCAPVWGDALEFRRDFWHEKSTVPGLSYGVVIVVSRLAVLVQCRLVTDRQTETDGHTTISSTALAYRRAVECKTGQ